MTPATVDVRHLPFAHTTAMGALGSKLAEATLDWMEADKGTRVTNLGKTWYARDDYGLPHHRAPTLREAIDTARAAVKGAT